MEESLEFRIGWSQDLLQRHCIDTIVSLAAAHRLAKIWYCKLTENRTTERLIEPYRFLEHEDNLMIQSWQIRPPCETEVSWRTFRCDCIRDVSDGGAEFTPRRPVELHTGTVDSFMSLFTKRREKPAAKYRDYLIRAIRDQHLSEREKTEAENLAQKVATKDLKVIHAQVFSEVLFDALLDHSIAEEEEAFIEDVRGFMEQIGWAP